MKTPVRTAGSSHTLYFNVSCEKGRERGRRTCGDGECPATTEKGVFDHVAGEESAGDADNAEDDLLCVEV